MTHEPTMTLTHQLGGYSVTYQASPSWEANRDRVVAQLAQTDATIGQVGIGVVTDVARADADQVLREMIRTGPSPSTPEQKLETALRELETWVVDHDGDVDRTTFDAECQEAAHAALRLRGFRRIPVPLRGTGGLVDLDLAYAALGRSLPALYLTLGNRLNGTREYRQRTGAGDE